MFSDVSKVAATVYPDSDKIAVWTGNPDDEVIVKRTSGVDYWDFRRVHRDGLIACVYRAAEWRHKDVELAAHDLLQLLDRTSG